MKPKTIIFLIIFNILLLAHHGKAENLKRYQTALNMYQAGYYNEARTLLTEIYYSNTLTNPYNLYARLLIGGTYLKEKMYSKAIKEFRSIQNEITDLAQPSFKIECELNYQTARALFLSKNLDQFYEEREKIVALLCPPSIDKEINTMYLAALVYKMRWNEALKSLNENTINKHSNVKYIRKKLIEVNNHRNKSPLLGGFLSLIPGLGHIYAGRYADGVRDFLFNVTFTTLSLYTAVEKKYVFTGIFGIIESILYLSNIYGGVNAVTVENASYYVKMRNSILKKIYIDNRDFIVINIFNKELR